MSKYCKDPLARKRAKTSQNNKKKRFLKTKIALNNVSSDIYSKANRRFFLISHCKINYFYEKKNTFVLFFLKELIFLSPSGFFPDPVRFPH